MNTLAETEIIRRIKQALPKMSVQLVREIEALAADELDKRRLA